MDAQMNVTTFITKEYENIVNWTLGENKPNSKPIKANLMLLKIALSSNRFLRYNESVMKNILLRNEKHGHTQ